MTSCSRLLTTLQHQEPDRVPLDLASTQVTGISVKAYEKLRACLGLPAKAPQICDAIQQICLPHHDILNRFCIDTRGLWPVMNHTDFTDDDDGEYLFHTDEWGFSYRIPKVGGLWYDLYRHPLSADTLSLDMIQNFHWPRGNAPYRIAGLREQALHFHQQGFPIVLKSISAGLLEMMIRIRGMENALIDLVVSPKEAGALLDRILLFKLEYWDMALNELGEFVDVVAEGDDFGTQTSQLISPETFRKIIKPRQVDLIQFLIEKAPKACIFFHSCGNVREYLPDFIEMGIDILNPVHITAAGMAPKELKQDFGKDIVFWGGGIDTQCTLPHGTPIQVRDEVKRNLDVLAPGGGYVFNTIHNIQADVPPDNIVAMYEAVLEFGKYR